MDSSYIFIHWFIPFFVLMIIDSGNNKSIKIQYYSSLKELLDLNRLFK